MPSSKNKNDNRDSRNASSPIPIRGNVAPESEARSLSAEPIISPNSGSSEQPEIKQVFNTEEPVATNGFDNTDDNNDDGIELTFDAPLLLTDPIEPKLTPIAKAVNEIFRINKEVFDITIEHIKGNYILIVPAIFAALIGTTSWYCNAKAVPALFNNFEKTYDIQHDLSLLESTTQILAEIGGGLGNLVLNYFSTLLLIQRAKIIWQAIRDRNPYAIPYITIGFCAIASALGNGYINAESATTPQKKILDFLVNTLAALGPNMLYCLIFVNTLLRSSFFDLVAKICNSTNVDEHGLVPANQYVYSTAYNAFCDLVKRTGYALSAHSITKQIKIITAIFTTMECNDYPINSDSENLLLPKNDLSYLHELTTYIAKLPIEKKLEFYFQSAIKLEVKPSSTMAGLTLSVVNSISFFAALYAALANMTSVKNVAIAFSSLFIENKTQLNAIGNVVGPFGYVVKVAMYWNSLLGLIAKAFFLPETLSWLQKSSLLTKIIMSFAPLILAFGLASGACYGLDALNLYPELLNGLLAAFFAHLAVHGDIIGKTITTFIAALGAGWVNAFALLQKLIDVLLTILHILQPQQKESDQLSMLGTALSTQLITGVIPGSATDKAVEAVMRKFADCINQEKEKEKETQTETVNPDKKSCTTQIKNLVSCGFWGTVGAVTPYVTSATKYVQDTILPGKFDTILDDANTPLLENSFN